jgi:transcriptional regulator GlxA family with amidase domain
MKLGILAYEGVDLLDVMGPYEMFSWVDKSKGLETLILSACGDAVTSGNGVRFHTHASFRETPKLDIVWVPGGIETALQEMLQDQDSPYFTYLRKVSVHAKWVCSVCEGAMLLARAGLLDGHRATTHWAFVRCLQEFREIEVDTTHQRFVVSGNRLTGGGISAGLDEALKLITLLYDEATAEQVQVTTQYFPKPPVSGSIPPTPACTLTW